MRAYNVAEIVYRCDWRIWATKSSRQTILRVSMRKKTSKSNWIKGNLVLWYSSYLIVVYIMLLEGEEDNISVLWPVATMPASLSQPFALRLNDRQFLCNDKIFSIIDGGIVSFFLHVCYMYHGVKFTNFFHRTWSCQYLVYNKKELQFKFHQHFLLRCAKMKSNSCAKSYTIFGIWKESSDKTCRRNWFQE